MPLLTLPATRAAASAGRARAVVFDDPASLALLESLAAIGPSEATVLITGETGTGKELVARHLHALSARRDRPFVAVNCGALSESLIESELFGHERGAFTGAAGARAGWFEAAHGGTLFLDEIGELPLALQVKLLRVLQEREVVRLGARAPIAIDVRLIAATNANLVDDVARGRFRADLYYRLDVAAVRVPPLRERPGDVIALARHFVDQHAERAGVEPPVITASAANRLLAHAWPGNIRELENVMHRALVASRDGRIGPEHLQIAEPAAARSAPAPAPAPAPVPIASPAPTTPIDALESALLALYEHPPANLYARIEEAVIRTAYRFCDANQLQTARLLGISRNVVRARLIEFGELAGAPRRAETARPRPVRVGYQKFGLLGLVKARGALDRAMRDRGVRLEWLEFPSGTQLLDALAAGGVDLGVVGEGPPILAQAANAPIVYLAAEPPAPHDEAIVVHADAPYRTVADLKGKTIALSKGSSADYLVVRALDEARLTYDDVKIAAVPPTGARAAFESREVDAWAIWNPLLAWISYASGARVLRDGAGLAPNTAYYVGARSFADAHPELIAAFLDEVQATGRWANDNTERVVELLAHALAMPRPPLAAALARSRFGARPFDDDTLAAQQAVADTFHRVKLIPHPVRIADAVWAPPRAA
jgi:aliphatic sulfonates family ABC transporter substrate-binding protein